MANSSIFTLRTYTERCSLYTAVVAASSSGKSPALKVVKDALRKVESYEEIPLEKSKILNRKLKLNLFTILF